MLVGMLEIRLSGVKIGSLGYRADEFCPGLQSWLVAGLSLTRGSQFTPPFSAFYFGETFVGADVQGNWLIFATRLAGMDRMSKPGPAAARLPLPPPAQ